MKLDAVTTAYVATPNYKRGMGAAINVHAFGNTPNWGLIDKAHADFQRGFRSTWQTLTEGGRP